MLKRIPIVPTLIVLIAVGIMVRLGFWQLDRMHQKAALIAEFQAQQAAKPVTMVTDNYPLPYRKVAIECVSARQPEAKSGRNDRGESGWKLSMLCITDNGMAMPVVLGWSRDFHPVPWDGGAVTGTYLADKTGSRVIANPPLAGLQANAVPDPKDLPNNHWSYAIQWFAFALTALVIYGLALRKRLAAPGAAG